VWGIGRRNATGDPARRLPPARGTNVFISQWVTQRDPRFSIGPNDFLPERWNDEFEKRLPKFAYFPFGGGPRVCIGASFASMEAALLLATIAQRFRLTLAAGHPVHPYASAALRPKHGIASRCESVSFWSRYAHGDPDGHVVELLPAVATVELRSRADRWLACARRGRSPRALDGQNHPRGLRC